MQNMYGGSHEETALINKQDSYRREILALKVSRETQLYGRT